VLNTTTTCQRLAAPALAPRVVRGARRGAGRRRRL